MRLEVTLAGLKATAIVSGAAKNVNLSVDWDDGSVATTGKAPAKAGEPVSLGPHTYANEVTRIVVVRADNDDVAYTVLRLAQITAGDLAAATAQGRIVVDRTARSLDGDRFTVTAV